MAAAGFAFGHWMRSRASENPNFSYQSGGGDHVGDVDGILTPYGQWTELQGAIRFVLIGIAIAMVVRMIVGPAGEPEQVEASGR